MTSPTPTQLGRYEIVGEIGRGAMGLVYLAQDPIIGRLVAIKTLRTEKIPPEQQDSFRERFLREAQSAGILSHPNIVTVHDVVEDGGSGVPFIAMEYVRGGNLRDLLRSGKPLPFDFVVTVVEQVASALDYAHSMGVVHRDVKPANIMITGDERVKITDFGIAQVHSGSLTHEGEMVGTPNYMAPEQVLGKEVDWRADIFSLGVLVYEMLTCHKPFFGESLTVVTQRIAYEPFTPPGKWAGDLPSGVDVLLDRALHKEPSLRYQTAGALADDLRQIHENADSLNDTVATMAIPVVAPAAGGTGESNGPALQTQALEAGEAAKAGEAGKGNSVVDLLREMASRKPVVVGALAAFVVVALFAIGILAHRGAPSASTPKTAPEPVQTDPQLDLAAKLAQQGEQLLDKGQPEAALVLFKQAQQLNPQDASISSSIALAKEQTEAQRKKAGEAQRNAERQGRIDGLLISARADLSAGRFVAAEQSAAQVLVLDPTQSEAREIRRRARREVVRRREALARKGKASAEAGASAGSAAHPAGGGPTASPVEAESRVKIDFSSELPQGVLTVYVGQHQILRQPFRFVHHLGFMREEPTTGHLEAMRRLPPGTTDFRIYVSLSHQGAKLVRAERVLQAGGDQTLKIDVDKNGAVTARFE